MKKLFYPLFFILFCLQTVGIAEDDWKRVFLVTYPRSGNHWLRHLIEDASYIATSSVYIDEDTEEPKHLKAPFPWGGYAAPHGYSGKCRYPTKNDLILLKTHYPSFSHVPFDTQSPIKSIRIIRHPVDTFVSLSALYRGTSASSRIPQDFLLQMINTWRLFQEYWDKEKDVMTIRYEDLYQDPVGYLKKVLAELNYSVTDKDIERAVALNPPQGKPYKHIDGFNTEDLALVEQRLGDLMEKYHYPLRTNCKQ